MPYSRILVRAANWVGDAVMSLPALRALRSRHRNAQLSVLAMPWVQDLYAREPFADEILPYTAPRGVRGIRDKLAVASDLRSRNFDCAVLLPNSFDSALVAWLAGIPERIGYSRDGRAPLLTRAIPPPKKGAIPAHESYYYLELMRRAGWIENLPDKVSIQLDGAAAAAGLGRVRLEQEGLSGHVIGVSPGAAYGTAKRWPPERFAAAAAKVAAALDAAVALFGSRQEQPLCEQVRQSLDGKVRHVRNFAGQTSLGEFIELAASCRAFLTNDSGAMHIAAALGVPTVAVFGATDHAATGPAGPRALVVRELVDCSPCLLRECPIDHRCMWRVTAELVAEAALDLLK